MSFFSVIIPTFNRADVLSRAVKSVLNQSFKDFELIIVDDGSIDHTESLVSGFDKIKYIKIENSGVSAARNTGVEVSKGEYLAFLDSDDEWLEDKLSKQFDRIKETASPIVHGEEIWIRNGKRVNPKNIHQKSGGDIFERSTELCLMSPSTIVIYKDLFLEAGGFREDFPVCEDYDLWLKLTSESSVEFIETPIINKYGGHEDQLSTKYKAMDYYRVKSLNWILKNRDLSESKRAKAKSVLLKKCEILLNGYTKHNNLENYSEIESVLNSYIS